MIRNILLHNHSIKILSICVGYMAWFFIAQHQQLTRIQELPLCFFQEQELYEIKAPDSIQVIVAAHRQCLQYFKPEYYDIQVDISGYKEGRHVIQLSKENITLPDSIKLLQLIPTHISIELCKKQGH